MSKMLKYSVLRYSPEKITGEFINLGILFSEESLSFHDFHCSKNISRIVKFDDMLDSRVLRDFLTGIKKDVLGYPSSDVFDIDMFVKYYINDYVFEKPKCIQYKDLDEMLESLKRTYFRFDYPKHERPTKYEDQRMISKIISASGIDLTKNKTVTGKYNESIQYDIVTDDFYIKLFDFDGKELSRCVNAAKTWAWNTNNNDKKTYIIYRYSDKNPKDDRTFKIISDIFGDSKAEFYSIDECVDILQDNVKAV